MNLSTNNTKIILGKICMDMINQYQNPLHFLDKKLNIVPALNFPQHFINKNGKSHDNGSTLFLSLICSCLNTRMRETY